MSVPEAALRWGTYGVLYYELVGPFLLCFPFYTEVLRLVAIVAFCAMHISFGSCLNIGLFQWIPCCCMLAFLPPMLWDYVLPRTSSATVVSPKHRALHARTAWWQWYTPDIIITYDSSNTQARHVRWLLAICRALLLVPRTRIEPATARHAEEMRSRSVAMSVQYYTTNNNNNNNNSRLTISSSNDVLTGFEAILAVIRASPVIGGTVTAKLLTCCWPIRSIAEPILLGSFKPCTHIHSLRHMSTAPPISRQQSWLLDMTQRSMVWLCNTTIGKASRKQYDEHDEDQEYYYQQQQQEEEVQGEQQHTMPVGDYAMLASRIQRRKRTNTKASSAQVERYVKIGIQSFVALMMVYVTLWNLASHFHEPAIVPSSLRWIAFFTRLDQWWGMFSPNAPSVSGWFVVCCCMQLDGNAAVVVVVDAD
jgi:hypothetical protein